MAFVIKINWYAFFEISRIIEEGKFCTLTYPGHSGLVLRKIAGGKKIPKISQLWHLMRVHSKEKLRNQSFVCFRGEAITTPF